MSGVYGAEAGLMLDYLQGSGDCGARSLLIPTRSAVQDPACAGPSILGVMCVYNTPNLEVPRPKSCF